MDDPQPKIPAAASPQRYSPRPIPPTVPSPPAPPPAATTPPPEKENIKETIESILVAFILAFVFRAFLVEAFVIPSGSMAPTLLGAHMRFRCPDCGYAWDVNYSPPRSDQSSDDIDVPNFAVDAVSDGASG